MRRFALLAFVALLGCTESPDAPSSSGQGPFPTPAAPETLLPVVYDTDPPDDTATLPADALFGGNTCTALVPADFAGLGAPGEPVLASADSCAFPLGDGNVAVQLASPDQFSHPGNVDQEIAPVDGVGLDAIGVDLGDRYQVFVQVENGYFSVTAPDRRAAERLAKAAAGRATP